MIGLLKGPGMLRLVLSALVVLNHLSNIELGRPAVFAFFMLSGYWVLRMYDEKYQPAVGQFYLSRFLRIWIPFVVAYLLALAVMALGFGRFEPATLPGLALIGIATTQRDVLGVSWSLDLEMQFYALVPLIWILMRKQQGPGVFIALVAAGTVLGWWLQLTFGIWTVLSYGPAFAMGALIWVWNMNPSRKVAFGSLALFWIIGAVLWLGEGTRAFLLHDQVPPINGDWFGMAWVAVLVPFVAWNVRQRSGPFDRHLGNYSYSLYIVHFPVIWMGSRLLGPVDKVDKIAILGAIVALSVLFYLLVDRPAERMRLRMLETRPA